MDTCVIIKIGHQTMFKKTWVVLFFSVLLFTSCEDDGTTFTGTTDPPQAYDSNLSGNGCTGST